MTGTMTVRRAISANHFKWVERSCDLYIEYTRQFSHGRERGTALCLEEFETNGLLRNLSRGRTGPTIRTSEARAAAIAAGMELPRPRRGSSKMAPLRRLQLQTHEATVRGRRSDRFEHRRAKRAAHGEGDPGGETVEFTRDSRILEGDAPRGAPVHSS